MPNDIFLETRRLILKPTTQESLELVYPLFSSPEVMRYIGKGIRTREETQESLDKMIKHYDKHGFSMCNAFEKETGEFVGRAGLIYLELKDDQPEIEIGFVLHKQYWKNGYATELARAVLDWGFKHLKVDKLVAVLYPENDRSRHVLEKMGGRYIGLVTSWGVKSAKYEFDRPNLDVTKLELVPATIADYPLLQNMGRFYVYDMSEYLGQNPLFKIPDDGLFECIDFKKYWETPDTFPFLLKYDKEVAGFLIVDKKGSEARIDFNMSQFFILRKFKSKGLGRQAAYQCFTNFQGSWEVMVLPGNEGSYRFWRHIINEFTHGSFNEYTREVTQFGSKKWNIFNFESRGK